ncbi:glycosyltransferase family 4 protein [Desulfosarcina alkanivorans]
MFNLIKHMDQGGIDILPFSVTYDQNQPSQYRQYFVPPIGRTDQVYFHEHERSLRTFSRTLSRLIFSREVEKAVSRMIEETKPDIAYILCYLRKLSPSLLKGIKKHNLPIVARLSDFGMVCPQQHCLRSGKPCTLCVEGNLLPSIRHRCVKGSHLASAVDAMATWYHRFKRYFELIDCFIATNPFMAEIMVRAGYPDSRIECIPTFTDTEAFKPTHAEKNGKQLVYIGRLDPPKGLEVLIEAMGILKNERKIDGLKAVVIGAGHDQDYVSRLHRQIQTNNLERYVDMKGKMPPDTIADYLGSAYMTVIPSIWYENLPNTLIESYACGTPVVASKIGSLAMVVEENQTGLLFEPGNANDLADKLCFAMEHPSRIHEYALNCYQKATNEFSYQAHIDLLMKTFERFV